MANITLKLASTGVEVPVNDVDLNSVTNTELFTNAVSAGVLPALNADEEYLMVSKESNMPIKETATLSDLKFKDGDIIKVIAKGTGAK